MTNCKIRDEAIWQIPLDSLKLPLTASVINDFKMFPISLCINWSSSTESV